MSRQDAIEAIINNGYTILDDTYEDNKEKLSDFKREVFENFQKKYLDQDKQTHKQLKTEVEMLIINGGTA